MKLLAKVREVFSIPGRGVVVIPDLVDGYRVRSGDRIQLRNEDGLAKDTSISGVELAFQGSEKGCCLAFILGAEVAKADVSRQSEIWIAD